VGGGVRDADHGAEIVDNAASPDEGALVKAARVLGYSFKERTPLFVKVDVCGKDAVYTILNVIEVLLFNPPPMTRSNPPPHRGALL
jgi:hypothetical protein